MAGKRPGRPRRPLMGLALSLLSAAAVAEDAIAAALLASLGLVVLLPALLRGRGGPPDEGSSGPGGGGGGTPGGGGHDPIWWPTGPDGALAPGEPERPEEREPDLIGVGGGTEG